MSQERLEKTRNIGIIAHIDAGKTTTTERILFLTGMTHRLGSVDEGSTITDFMPQERERGITIQSAAITSEWAGHQINIIDTPGHIDFTAEVQRALRVLDGGVVVFDGVAGVEPQSETVWHQADRYSVPRICFVNKMDRVGASMTRTVEMIRERLKARPIVVAIPIGEGQDFAGYIDLVHMRQYSIGDSAGPEEPEEAISPELLPEAERQREAMVEQLADVDDDIALAYLEGEELTPAALTASLRRATCSGAAVPVLCGSSMRSVGIRTLLDAVVSYLPSPLDVPPMVGEPPEAGDAITCRPDDTEPVAALIFKVTTDPFMGKLVFFRVYSGVVQRGGTVYSVSAGRTERIGRLLRVRADRREEVEAIRAGDIGAVLGLKMAQTGRTICDPARPVVLEEITFPTPVIEISIAPQRTTDQDKLGVALSRLTDEDPTLVVRTDERTDETTIAGMGELHLDVVVDRIRREFKVDVRVGAPQVAYCETITRAVQSEGRLVKQTGGHGQYAVVKLQLEPLSAGSGLVFENKIVGGAIPKEYIPAVRAGVMRAIEQGVLAKQPVVDIKVTLVDGRYHEVDSSERAFEAAGALGLREGLAKAGPILLEPIMRVEIVAQQDYLGDVISDLGGRAATVIGIEPHTLGVQTIAAHVPLARMFGYATALRSATQGRGTFSMQFSHYQQVNEETRESIQRAVAVSQ